MERVSTGGEANLRWDVRGPALIYENSAVKQLTAEIAENSAAAA